MSGLSFDSSSWGQFVGADTVSTDSSYNQPRTSDTVPSNAVQSMQPVSNNASGEWTGFFQDLTRGVLGYAVQRDAVRNQARAAALAANAPTPTYASTSAPAAGPMGGIPTGTLLIAGLVAVAVFAAVKLGGK